MIVNSKFDCLEKLVATFVEHQSEPDLIDISNSLWMIDGNG